MRRRAVAIAVVLGCGPGIVLDRPSGGGNTSDATPRTTSTSESDAGSTSTTSTTSEEGSSSVTGAALVDVGDWPAGFILDPDGAWVSTECSIWDQDCPPGEKCMPWANDGGNAWNATRCSPIAPDPGQPGEPCTVERSGVSGIDDCDIASMCWYVDPETNVGSCVAFCVGSMSNPICTAPQHDCDINAQATLALCMAHCDPLAQDCPHRHGCYGLSDAFQCAPDASGEMGAFGDTCEYMNVCDPGLACATMQLVPGCVSSGCCSPYCDIQTPDCLDGQECLPYFIEGEAPPGYENVGICGVAP